MTTTENETIITKWIESPQLRLAAAITGKTENYCYLVMRGKRRNNDVLMVLLSMAETLQKDWNERKNRLTRA